MIGSLVRDLAAGLPPAVVLLAVIAVAVAVFSCGWVAIAAGVVALVIGLGQEWSNDAILVATTAAFGAGYIGHCLYSPRAPCWWCRGKARRTDSGGFWHNCLVCGGSGQRRRWGARVLARHRPD